MLRASGWEQLALKRYTESRTMFEQAERLAEDVRGPDDRYVAALQLDVAFASGKIPDNDATDPLYTRAFAALDRDQSLFDLQQVVLTALERSRFEMLARE